MPRPKLKKSNTKTTKTNAKARVRAAKAATFADLRAPFPLPPLPPATPDEPTPPLAAVRGLVDRILTEKRELTPKAGFNLVGLDDYELPGECLYLIAHYATRKEAEAAMKRRPVSDRMFIYGPDDL